MKKILAFCFIFILGCSYGGDKIQTIMDDPKTLLEDPLSVEHQQALDDLEKEYLHQNITYAEYLERKKQIEEDYARDVQKRETYD